MSIQDCISCDPYKLYINNPLYEEEYALADIANNYVKHKENIDFISEVFPSAHLVRNTNIKLISEDAEYIRRTIDHYDAILSNNRYIPPSILVRLSKAVIWNNMLFVDVGDRLMPVYEFYRKTDRTEKGLHLLGRLAACKKHEVLDLGLPDKMFIGSAGSFNYGHWLIDDLPMLAGCSRLGKDNQGIRVLMSGYSEGINNARIEGLKVFVGPEKNADVLFLDINTAYHVEDLYYVTPATYHPHSKNPYAMHYLSQTCDSIFSGNNSGDQMTKIFINRSGHSQRGIKNNEELKNFVLNHEYIEIMPEDLSFTEQMRVFSNAKSVIGVMGASMANSVFCHENTNITYLAPTGWVEPFYWDLSCMRNQKSSVIYGEVEDHNRPAHDQRFSINISDVETIIQGLS